MSLRCVHSPCPTAKPSYRRRAGFTAIELLVVIAIAAILVSLALPSFRSVIARYRVQLATDEMTSSIYFARSEAIKRGGQVVLQKNPTATGCTAPTAQEWSCGWFVYFDADASGTFNAGDEVLQRSGVAEGVDVMTTLPAGFAALRFDRWGRSPANSFFGFNFQPANFPAGTTKLVCMSIAGRLRTLTDVAPPCP